MDATRGCFEQFEWSGCLKFWNRYNFSCALAAESIPLATPFGKKEILHVRKDNRKMAIPRFQPFLALLRKCIAASAAWKD